MPRDMATSTEKIIPTFAIISQRLMVRLATKKAPSCAIYVIQALLGYSFGKDSCFPNHKTIQSWLGGKEAIALSTIRKALKWLEDHGFIKRNHRRSKDRYVLFIDRPNRIKSDREQQLTTDTISPSLEADHLPSSIETQNPKVDHPTPSKKTGEGSNRYERSASTDTNVAHKSKQEENNKPPISPVQNAQGTQQTEKPFSSSNSPTKTTKTTKRTKQTSRRRTKEERALAKAQKRDQEEKIIKENSYSHRKNRLEHLIFWIALFKNLPPVEFHSDLDHLERYTQQYIESASPEGLKILKITDRQAFLRLTKHLIWRQREYIDSARKIQPASKCRKTLQFTENN